MKRISVLDFIEKIQAVPDIDVKIDDAHSPTCPKDRDCSKENCLKGKEQHCFLSMYIYIDASLIVVPCIYQAPNSYDGFIESEALPFMRVCKKTGLSLIHFKEVV